MGIINMYIQALKLPGNYLKPCLKLRDFLTILLAKK